jgi:hypothetical protein
VLAVAGILSLAGAAVAVTGPWTDAAASRARQTAGGTAAPSAVPAGPVKVAAVDDAYVSYAAMSEVSGNSAKLVASSKPGDRKVSYLRFRVSAAELLSRSSVRLVLTRDLHHLPGDVQLYSVPDDHWSEKTISAATAPELGAELGSVSPGFATTDTAFDVTTTVRTPGDYSFAITSTSTDDVARFQSKEAGDLGPYLLIDDTGTAAAATPAPTLFPPQPEPSVQSTASSTPTPTPSPTPAVTPPPGGGELARPTCAVSDKLVPSCAMWWGVAPRVFTSLTMPAALKQAEDDAGRPYDIVHRYHVNSQLFPTVEERSAARESGRNRILFLNYKPATDLTWRQVADGVADARIDRLAQYIRTTYHDKFFLAIWHEPENDVDPAAGSGMTAPDYAAMFKHTVERLRAGGVTNAVTVVAYMGFPKWGATSWFNALYPGDDVVDWIGFDPYGSGEPASAYLAGDFAKLVNRTDGLKWDGSYNWAAKTHPRKPLMLAEWGIYESGENPNGKAAYYASVAQQIAQFPKFKALVYFDMPRGPDTGKSTSASSSTASLNAYRQLGRDPRMVAPSPSAAMVPR